ncbi:MAG TPA: 2-isopropylmalate synthase [Myxococcales bacterium]|nr:2-isopropylmalate synthase [Myxococcales bacterium]
MNPEQLNNEELIYDWNLVNSTRPIAGTERVLLYDETLRDGIQSPSVVDPSIENKLQLVHLMDDLGIDYADIGLPGAGPRAVEDVTRIAQEMVNSRMSLKASCAARTHINDIRPIVEISQKVGIEIEVMAFMGSSPIRQFAEDWDMERMLKMSSEAITFAYKNNVPVSFVTEDTVRSRPDTLEILFKNAIECGARRLCLCDTCGHATPDGVRSLVEFSKKVIDDMGMTGQVFLDWHGHNDRGLALTNAIRALEAGVDRLHGTGLGIGERVGNTMMDQLLLNLKLLGVIDNDLSSLLAYCRSVSEATRWEIPKNYPLAGSDAFRTATGVHASAIIKAEKKGDQWLADRIYSGVPASEFGKQQEIEIGHMSGASNVHYWLTRRNIQADEQLVDAILSNAKATNRTLAEEEIMAIVRKHKS